VEDEFSPSDFEIKYETDHSEGFFSNFDFQAAEARTKKFFNFLPDSESSDGVTKKKTKQDPKRIIPTRGSTKMLGSHSLRSSKTHIGKLPSRRDSKAMVAPSSKTIKKPSPPTKKPVEVKKKVVKAAPQVRTRLRDKAKRK